MDRLEICMTVFLGINTWTDIRKKEICVPVLGVFLAGGNSVENMGRDVLGRGVDFYGSRYNCGGDIGADQGRNRIWRRTSDSGNGICTEKWRITGGSLRRTFTVWNLFRPAASGV